MERRIEREEARYARMALIARPAEEAGGQEGRLTDVISPSGRRTVPTYSVTDA